MTNLARKPKRLKVKLYTNTASKLKTKHVLFTGTVLMRKRSGYPEVIMHKGRCFRFSWADNDEVLHYRLADHVWLDAAEPKGKEQIEMNL